jgi:hypothetical protein
MHLYGALGFGVHGSFDVSNVTTLDEVGVAGHDQLFPAFEVLAWDQTCDMEGAFQIISFIIFL